LDEVGVGGDEGTMEGVPVDDTDRRDENVAVVLVLLVFLRFIMTR
jgi:hypothetical protein